MSLRFSCDKLCEKKRKKKPPLEIHLFIVYVFAY